MRISKRMAQVQPLPVAPGEHAENIGGPKVTIEPGFQDILQHAVDFVNKTYPDLLKDVTDVYGHVDKGGIFGEYKSESPHSVYVDVRNIEAEVKRQMPGVSEGEIKSQIGQQIVKTLIHEASHKKEFTQTGHTSEAGPEAAEKAVEPLLRQMQ